MPGNRRKRRWTAGAMTLLLIGMLSSGCGISSGISAREPLPPFPAFPELSPAFYERAPREDLDRLLKREWELTAWQRKAEGRTD